MSTPSGRASVPAVPVTPAASSNRSASSAAPLTKEDERRLKLLQWQESKASAKKAAPPERKAAPDRKAQFFERRERRLQEEEKKRRMSRPGKENSGTPRMRGAVPTNQAVTPSEIARTNTNTNTNTNRLLSTPRPAGLARPAAAQPAGEGEGGLAGTTTPLSALRGPPSRARQQAAATPSSVAKGTGRVAGGARAESTPTRPSALLPPKASPYRDRARQNEAIPPEPLGGDEPGRPAAAVAATTPGDRLSGQLARLSAASRREGRIVSGSGGADGAAALGAAARRETFQSARSSSTTGSGATEIATARPVLRRASSAMPAAGGRDASAGEADWRRPNPTVTAPRRDRHQGSSTAAAAAAAAPTTSTTATMATTAAAAAAPTTTPDVSSTSVMQPLGVSRSSNTPSTSKPQLHPTITGLKQRATLTQEDLSGVRAAKPIPATAPTTAKAIVAGHRNATTAAEKAATAAPSVNTGDPQALPLSPQPSLPDRPVSSIEGKQDAEGGTRPMARVRKSDMGAAEGRRGDADRAEGVKGAAPMPAETPAPMPPELKQVRRKSVTAGVLSAARPANATGVAAALAPAALIPAVLEEELEGASGVPAAPPSLAEGPMISGIDGGAAAELRPSLFSRFSSVFSRRQQPPAVASATDGDGDGAKNEDPAVVLAVQPESERGKDPSAAPDLRAAEARRLPVARTGDAEQGREAGDNPALSPSGADGELPSEQLPDAQACWQELEKGVRVRGRLGERARGPSAAATAASSPAVACRSGLTPPGSRSKPSPRPAVRAESPVRKGPIESAAVAATGEDAKEATASPRRLRPALTPPGYRSRRPSLPAAGRTTTPPEAGTLESTSRESKESTTTMTTASQAPPPGPRRPAGLTPPGYRSRSPTLSASAAAAGRTAYPQGCAPPTTAAASPECRERKMASPAGPPRPTGLTPPGYRSRPFPPVRTGVEPPGRDAWVEGTVSGSGLGSSPASIRVRLTPDRRRIGAPVRAHQAEGSHSTPPRCVASPLPGSCSPPARRRQPLQAQEQQKPQRDDSAAGGDAAAAAAAAKDEREKGETQGESTGLGRSPMASSGGGIGSRKDDAESTPSRLPDDAPASAEPPIARAVPSPEAPDHAQQQQQQQQQRLVREEGGIASEKDVACSLESVGAPESPDSCFFDARASAESTPVTVVVASPRCFRTAEQQQQHPAGGGAAGDAGSEEDEEQRAVRTKDTACSPMALGGGSGDGSPKSGTALECSPPRFSVSPRLLPTSPITGSTGGRSENSTAGGPDDDVAGGAGRRSSGGRAAAAPQARQPEEEKGRPGEEREFVCSPNFAAGFVVGRRKRRAVSGVPVVTAAAVASPDGVYGGGGRAVLSELGGVRSSRQGLKGEEAGESSGDESGSSWETCSGSEEEDGGDGSEREEGGNEGWEGLSYLDEISEHAYTGGVVIDPDLVRSGSSSNGSGSARSSLVRSSFGEARSGGRPSWGVVKPRPCPPPSCVVTAETGTQTSGEKGVAHALLQAGDGKLLSEAELEDECNQRELRERLAMMEHDLLAEVFHREVVKQEEAQARRKLEQSHNAEVGRLRDEVKSLKLDHDNEKIKMRWEHADELARAEAEAGDGAGLRQELLEERKLREEDEERHAAAQQKERQQRREWEGRCDELAREKREQARRHREEVAAAGRRAEGEAKKKLEALKKKLAKAQEVVKMQLETFKEVDRENDDLREENNQLRRKLGLEVVDYEEEEEQEEEGGGEEEEEEG